MAEKHFIDALILFTFVCVFGNKIWSEKKGESKRTSERAHSATTSLLFVIAFVFVFLIFAIRVWAFFNGVYSIRTFQIK